MASFPLADLAAFADFVTERVNPIPGWLNPEAALLSAHLAGVQKAGGLRGAWLEIGVFKGKYLAVLYAASEMDEPIVAVDLFLGARDKAAVIDAVRANIRAACGEERRLRMVVADSRELTADRLRAEAGRDAFRFVSIDGGHTRELVFHDLEVAAELLGRGGIIALDDAFNHTTPGVMEGIAEFFIGRKPALAPFAHCYNKLFVTTPESHARYVQAAWDFVDRVTWLPTHERTLHWRRESLADGFVPRMFGYEVVPFL